MKCTNCPERRQWAQAILKLNDGQLLLLETLERAYWALANGEEDLRPLLLEIRHVLTDVPYHAYRRTGEEGSELADHFNRRLFVDLASQADYEKDLEDLDSIVADVCA